MPTIANEASPVSLLLEFVLSRRPQLTPERLHLENALCPKLMTTRTPLQRLVLNCTRHDTVAFEMAVGTCQLTMNHQKTSPFSARLRLIHQLQADDTKISSASQDEPAPTSAADADSPLVHVSVRSLVSISQVSFLSSQINQHEPTRLPHTSQARHNETERKLHVSPSQPTL